MGSIDVGYGNFREGYCTSGVLYKAVVNIDEGVYRIYYKFYWKGDKRMLWIAKSADGVFAETHCVSVGDDVQYVCPNGTWIVHFSKECYPMWLLKRDELWYSPTISLATNEVAPKETLAGKHYDMIIEDDMPSSTSTIKEANEAARWHKMQTQYHLKPDYKVVARNECGIPLVLAKRHRSGVITTIKEVKNKMTCKSLYHVILFNRKTEEIDFKAIIPAKCDADATMQAAQTYGKYDSNTHKVIVKELDCSDYETVK